MSDTEFRPIDWRSACETDVGTVREVNEDAILLRPDIHLWAVADGMGGHSVGDIASQTVVAALECIDGADLLSEFVNQVDDALIKANSEIIAYSENYLNSAPMGTTVVSLITRGRVGVCLWVGDSRLYRLRGGELSQLSRDHSQVEELVQMGVITPEQAIDHPDSHVITRAVGGETDVYVDINLFSVQIGDTFLLCSDGLYNAVEIEDIADCLAVREPDDASAELMRRALGNHAKDNVSLVVVRGEAGNC
ncbi:PP2C family protein-serine/threonine phosphatase [Teredinibacter turnerae]|uniref:PP2C family protein-serine/threonine phosphatase n=1 Tax=Teredinibacter turnerae TaxID=2426 RepID=UPI0030D39614